MNRDTRKTIVTVTGIRPDFIRMSEVFSKLDENFNHIMIHTGQHYEEALNDVFFKDLKIRKPDYELNTGRESKTPYEQLSYLATNMPRLLAEIVPKGTTVMFLGDSNTAMVAPTLFKEGYKIAHIEGGMRSYDRRMPEEVNRVLCDYVSDLILVYTPLYKERLLKENRKKTFPYGPTKARLYRRRHSQK